MSIVKKTKSMNFFTILLLVAIISTMGAVYYDNTILKLVSYGSDVLLIIYSLLYLKWKWIRKTSKTVILCFVILAVNYMVSPYEHSYVDLLKFFGYLCLYLYGYSLAVKYDRMKVNKLYLSSLVIIPAAIVLFFDSSLLKNSFFVTSNVFVYTGLAMGLYYLLINYGGEKSFWLAWIIVGVYVLICTSLGVIVAIFMAFLILNFKSSHVIYLVLGSFVLISAVLYVDLPIFVRFRDVIMVWTSMSADDWKNIQDIDLYQLGYRVNTVGERGDSTSSIWRLSQWMGLFMSYISNIESVPFGLGVGYSVDRTGYMPHNDYIRILTEYGIVIFSCFLKFVISVYRRMKMEKMLIYFILAMFVYFFTENLIHIFPPNACLFFTIGWCMSKCVKNKRPVVIVENK